MNTSKFKLLDRIKSFKFALNGIRLLIVNEHNARIHLFVTILVCIACFFFSLNSIEISLVVFSIGLVFISELINTAIENIANFIEPEWNENIGRIKDYAAGAVLVSALVSIVIAFIIFLPKVTHMLIK